MKPKENRKRYIQRIVRLTPEEDAQIKRAMQVMQAPTFQYYAKNQLVQGRIVHVDLSEIRQLRIALNRIGTNINQIAKVMNETQTVETENVTMLLQMMANVRDMVAVKLNSEEKAILKKRKQRKIRTWD